MSEYLPPLKNLPIFDVEMFDYINGVTYNDLKNDYLQYPNAQGTENFLGISANSAQFASTLSITNNTSSTSKTTGALKVTGGAGIGNRLFVGSSTNTSSDLTSQSDLNMTSNYVQSGATWSASTTPNNGSWRSVAYSPTQKILVSLASINNTGTLQQRLMTSTDGGATWTGRNIIERNWTDVVWEQSLNRFVAVSYSATTSSVMYSTDGINWTYGNTTNTGYNMISWSPQLSKFCVVGVFSPNYAMTSSDGINWSEVATGVNNNWRGLAWSSKLGLFVAVTDVGAITMKSSDGINWTSNSCPNASWWNIAWSPELEIFVAVDNNPLGTNVMVSTNGSTWTTYSCPSGGWTKIVWAKEVGIFCVVGGSSNRVMTSLDGKVWNSYASNPAGNSWMGLLWSKELHKFVATALDATTSAAMTNTPAGTLIVKGNLSVNNQVIINDGANTGTIEQVSTELTLSSSGNKIAISSAIVSIGSGSNLVFKNTTTTQLSAYKQNRLIDQIYINSFLNSKTIIKQNVNLATASLNTGTLGGGDIYFDCVGTLYKDQVITGAFYYYTALGTGTNLYIGLYNGRTGLLVASNQNFTLPSTGLIFTAFTTPYTIPQNDVYYVSTMSKAGIPPTIVYASPPRINYGTNPSTGFTIPSQYYSPSPANLPADVSSQSFTSYGSANFCGVYS